MTMTTREQADKSRLTHMMPRVGAGGLAVVCEKVVGIDQGTMNSAVAAMESGKPTIVTNMEGQRMPSVVAYMKNGDRLVG
jgi:heat shock protein 1/8